MKKKHAAYMFALAMLICLFLVPAFVHAQDPGGGPDVPIDGGLSILLAAGTAYGAKKYRDHRNKDKAQL